MPLVSIIVPVYKVEKYLDKCVQSIVNQTLADIEIILVNDGSPDNCPQMCDDWAKKDSRIKVIHQANGGLSDARNMGIKNSTADYIAFVDSDDYLDTTFAEKMWGLVIKNDAEIAICNFCRIYENGEIIFTEHCKIKNDVLTGKEVCLDFSNVLVTYISPCTKIYKKALFDHVLFPKGKINEDEAVAHRLIYPCKKVILSSDYLYYYVNHQNAENISSNITEENFTDAIEAFYDRVKYFLNMKEEQLQEEAEKMLVYSIFVQIGRINTFNKIAREKLIVLKENIQKTLPNINKNNKFSIKHKIILFLFNNNLTVARIVSRLGYKFLFKE